MILCCAVYESNCNICLKITYSEAKVIQGGDQSFEQRDEYENCNWIVKTILLETFREVRFQVSADNCVLMEQGRIFEGVSGMHWWSFRGKPIANCNAMHVWLIWVLLNTTSNAIAVGTLTENLGEIQWESQGILRKNADSSVA